MRHAAATLALVAFALGTEGLSSGADSATLSVPSDFPTINAALDASLEGDVVEVAAGSYDDFESRPVLNGELVSAVGFLKDGVILRSTDGPASTILRLDAASGAPVVLFGGEGDFVVEGFTFTGSQPGLFAVQQESSDDVLGSLALSNCEFSDFGTGNFLPNERAISTFNSFVEIRDCVFRDIDSPGIPTVTLDRGFVLENSSFRNLSGGALTNASGFRDRGGPYPEATVRGCTFIDVGGGPFERAIDAEGYFVTVEECLFLGESGAYVGGIYNATTASLRKCTFGPTCEAVVFGRHVEVSGNTFYGGGQTNGVLGVFGSGQGFGDAALERNVFSSVVGVPAVQTSSTTVHSSCNVFWNNLAGNSLGFALSPTDLVADPRFCDPPTGDFHVDATSICLPANNSGCGLIGAWGVGCGPVSIEETSWGRIKSLYR